MDAHSTDFGTITTPCNSTCAIDPLYYQSCLYSRFFIFYFILFLAMELWWHHKTRVEYQKPGVWPEQAAGLAANAKHCSPAADGCKWRKRLKAVQSLLDAILVNSSQFQLFCQVYL